LKNRTYLGEIIHKGQSRPGEHRPILDQAVWEAGSSTARRKRCRAQFEPTISPVAKLEAAHVPAELIDFADHVIAHHERRPAAHRLRIEVAPDQHVGVLQACRKYVDPHLAPAGRRRGRRPLG